MTRLLLYAQIPPPMHGQSVMVGHLLDGLRASDSAREAEITEGLAKPIVYAHINPQISESLGDIGRWRLRKLLLVFKFIIEAIRVRFRYGLDTLYFVPAPPKREGMYRDWCVLLFLRAFYPKLILHWHCIGQPEFVEKLNGLERFFARRLYGNATLSIALSNYSRDEAAYFASRHTVVIPNGIPDPCPRFDEEVWPEREKRAETLARAFASSSPEPQLYEVLFMAGRMTPKGLFDTMAAVVRANQILAARGLTLRMRLTVAGPFEDEERRRYEAGVADLNATRFPGQTVSLAVDAGWADEEKKRQLYRQADCFIFPTTYPAESFGLVLAEAMAHGCAVITTRWQAVPEVLPGGYENLVEPHDIEAMAEALLRCATAPADRSLRDYFCARFTSERFVTDIIQALSDV